jgi:hypothetical protein
MDDLSLLVDPEPAPAGLDDLAALLEDSGAATLPPRAPAMDDLSLLIGPEPALAGLDDLAALLDDPGAATLPPKAPAMDDLSLLVDVKPGRDDTHDLSALLDEAPEPPPSAHRTRPATPGPERLPSLEPTVSPEKDFDTYKSEIIAIIVEMKKQGLSAGDAAGSLNDRGIRTLRGKGTWSDKAIAKVYDLIDSATP